MSLHVSSRLFMSLFMSLHVSSCLRVSLLLQGENEDLGRRLEDLEEALALREKELAEVKDSLDNEVAITVQLKGDLRTSEVDRTR